MSSLQQPGTTDKNLNVLAIACSEQMEQLVKEEGWKEERATESPASPLFGCRFCSDHLENENGSQEVSF